MPFPPSITPSSNPSEVQTERLFQRITTGDKSAESELYSLIGRCVRANLAEFRDDSEDVHHGIFIDLVVAIKRGVIRKPGSLVPYVLTMIRRRKAELIRDKVRSREVPDVVAQVACAAARADIVIEQDEVRAIVRKALKRLPNLQQDVVRRFYLQEQPRLSVIKEVGLTEVQYRLCKSRGITRLRQYCVNNLTHPRLSALVRSAR